MLRGLIGRVIFERSRDIARPPLRTASFLVLPDSMLKNDMLPDLENFLSIKEELRSGKKQYIVYITYEKK